MVIGLIPMVFLGNSNTSYETLCTLDDDWPEKPCHVMTIGSLPTLSEEIEDWKKYFEFKGKVWMEEKRDSMLNANARDELGNWMLDGITINEGQNFSNPHFNVHRYYYLMGEVQPLEKIEGVSYADFPPPLKQLKTGTPKYRILCDFDLGLVFKSTNGQPACVKPSTYWKLLDRGWAN